MPPKNGGGYYLVRFVGAEEGESEDGSGFHSDANHLPPW